jgi:hypothetical protein
MNEDNLIFYVHRKMTITALSECTVMGLCEKEIDVRPTSFPVWETAANAHAS